MRVLATNKHVMSRDHNLQSLLLELADDLKLSRNIWGIRDLKLSRSIWGNGDLKLSRSIWGKGNLKLSRKGYGIILYFKYIHVRPYVTSYQVSYLIAIE